MGIWPGGEHIYAGLKLDYCLFSTIKNVCEIDSIYVGHRKWMFNPLVMQPSSV